MIFTNDIDNLQTLLSKMMIKHIFTFGTRELRRKILDVENINSSQHAKLKKYTPYMPLP